MATATIDKSIDVNCSRHDTFERLSRIESYAKFQSQFEGVEQMQVRSGNKAHMEAIVEAQHLPRHDHSRHYLMKNRYDIELARQGEVWVIERVTIDNVWRDGDPAVLSAV